MLAVPDTCPCCHAKLSASAFADQPRSFVVRCPHCALAIDDANQCPRCHAFMAVIERRGSYFCGACGSGRERLPATVCLTDAELLQALEVRLERSLYPWATTCALVWLNAGVFLDVTLPWRVLSITVGVVAFAWFVIREHLARRQRARRRTFEIEQRIIGLAYQNDGVLREQDVSTRLRISLAEARDVLLELTRQERAVACDLGGGVPEFRFGEARRTRAMRRRSEAPFDRLR